MTSLIDELKDQKDNWVKDELMKGKQINVQIKLINRLIC